MKRKNDATNKRVVGLVSRWFCLDPPAGGFRYGVVCFLAGIVPIPPHTQDIMPIVSMEKLFT